MPTLSPFAEFYLYDTVADKTQKFLDFRDNLTGTATDSNMMKADALFQSMDSRMNLMEQKPHVLTIYPTAATNNNFVANDVEDFEGYEVNSLYLIYFPQDTAGLSTININGEGVMSLMKISNGGVAINIEALDCKKGVGYLYHCDGNKFILIGEKFESVITSSTQPVNQVTGGIWNRSNSDGSVTSFVRAADGSYTAVPPTTQSKFVALPNGGTLEAADAQNVKLTGNQTIAGAKTFSTPPTITNTPTAATQAANKQYVDGCVKLTGNQTIAGTKTFSSNIVIPATPTANTHATSMQWVNSQLDNKANKGIQGNWTPTIIGSDGGSCVYSTQRGVYYKFDALVVAWFLSITTSHNLSGYVSLSAPYPITTYGVNQNGTLIVGGCTAPNTTMWILYGNQFVRLIQSGSNTSTSATTGDNYGQRITAHGQYIYYTTG